ncbi:MAG: TonB-dependent receptor plug domain-containing protein, partial [Deltaproteobacteria bacterium]|nr:TonB-dependent receptor plug domain-containing protein [Deltaproteobacteria bacterium]
MKRALSTGILGLLLLSVPAVAEEARPEAPPGAVTEENAESTAEDLVFVASRAAQKAFEVGRSLEVVDRRALERRSAQTLPDVLDMTPGVHLQKTNGGAGAPILRGMVGPDNLILVDGVRFNNSTFRTGPNQYLSLIDPWSLERVEIIRGPGSVWYGSDAMGGVLHAVTLTPRSLDNRWIGASATGTFASAVLGGGGTAQLDVDTRPFDGLLGGSYLYLGELRGGGGKMQPLSDLQRYGGRLRMRQDLGASWTLTEAAFWNSILGAGRTDTLGQGRARSYDNDDLLAYLRAERLGRSWLHAVRLNLSYHRTREALADWRCAADDEGLALDRDACAAQEQANLTRRERLTDVVDTVGFFATWEARVWQERIRIVAGADGYFDRIGSVGKIAEPDSWAWEDKERGNYSDGSTYMAVGGFMATDGDVVRVGEHALNVGGGVRYSWFAAHAGEVPGLGNVDYRYGGV